MERGIVVSADSTCDINGDLEEKYSPATSALHINLEGKEYSDGVDLDPDYILKVYKEKKILPKTSSTSEAEYIDHFEKIFSQGAREIIHISLSSKLSSSYQNATNAAIKLGNIYTVDSHNLSLGSGMLVIEAHEKIKETEDSAKQIAEKITYLREKCDISFVLSTLDFMSTGGRCPGVVALGANFLNIKPSIKVNSHQGKMSIAKMYRGKLESVLPKYIYDRLNGRKIANSRVFIVHSGLDKDLLDKCVETVKQLTNNTVEKIIVSRAGCTITCHCGPKTLGVAFLRE
ncbi:MAG: DegV family EDD domain-containing protein [Oscillospiraceae bacterium]|jgi:DegV family protein with EDD domain|nr:DegV family EDD domain-containing protein [Oscillospiraceae bacterium]